MVTVLLIVGCDQTFWWNQNATTMWFTKRRIIKYLRVQGRLPDSLSQLAEMPGYDNSICDAWGRALIYKILPNGDVSLTSLGRDGKPGGSAEDTDMTGIFTPLTADGRPADELADWKIDPIPWKAQTEAPK